MSTNSRLPRQVLVTLLLVLASACAPAVPSTGGSTGGTTGLPAAPGVLTGTVTYQPGSSPAGVLFAVNASDPSQWYQLDLPAAAGPQSFSMQVAAGTYRLVAYALDGSMVSALVSADWTLATVPVDSGGTAAGLALQLVAPQTPCQAVSVPAAPDGRFAALEGDPTCTPTVIQAATPTSAPGMLTGLIGYQGPPTPASVLYAVDVTDPQRYYFLEIPGSDTLLTFSLTLDAGTYELFAFTQDGTMAAALLTTPPDIATVTIGPGETIANIWLRLAAPQEPCQTTRVPASPDGRFAAIEPDSTCAASTQGAAPSAGKPNKPGSLEYEYVCLGGQITTTFTWIDGSNNEDGFRLYRNGVLVATLPANSSSTVDYAPTGAAYQYLLVAYNGAGESPSRSAGPVSCP